MIDFYKYRTEVDWSVLVTLDNGSKITLRFRDHDPNESEIAAMAAPFDAPGVIESDYEIETESGTVV